MGSQPDSGEGGFDGIGGPGVLFAGIWRMGTESEIGALRHHSLPTESPRRPQPVIEIFPPQMRLQDLESI